MVFLKCHCRIRRKTLAFLEPAPLQYLLKQYAQSHISSRKHYVHLRPASAHVISATGDRLLESMLTLMQIVISVVGEAATSVYDIVTL